MTSCPISLNGWSDRVLDDDVLFALLAEQSGQNDRERIGATECGTGAPILSAIDYRQSQWACVLSTAA